MSIITLSLYSFDLCNWNACCDHILIQPEFRPLPNAIYCAREPVRGRHSIPEPTTATLSLLALAGLAARRRRK